MEFSTTNRAINAYNVVYNLQTVFPSSSVQVLRLTDVVTFKVLGTYTQDQIDYYVSRLDINDLDGIRTPIIVNKDSKIIKLGTHTMFITPINAIAEDYPFIHITNHVTRKALDKLVATLDITYYVINGYAVLQTKRYSQLDINRMLVQALIGDKVNRVHHSHWNISSNRDEKNRKILEEATQSYVTPTLEIIENIELKEKDPTIVDPPECFACSNVDLENELIFDDRY